MLCGKWLACSFAMLAFAMLALIQTACSIQVICSSGDIASESSSVAMQIDAAKDASVLSEISITRADIKPSTSIPGLAKTFSQTHQVRDRLGKTAKVTVNVVNAPNGLEYRSELLPKEGALKTDEKQVSAEQWLTVPKADSIKCSAAASYMTLSADVSIEENKGKLAGDYVTLTGYDCKATASAKDITAHQTATSGSGSSIKISNHAKDRSGALSIETSITGTSGSVGSFQNLYASSSAGTPTQVTQKEHVVGRFTSTANSGRKKMSRTSNYGTTYDLIMAAANGAQPKGVIGYYVNPRMATGTTGAIQGAVNAAQSGDIINAAAGAYKEDVNINKAITLKGSGNPTAKSFTLNSIMGTGSGGITAPIIKVKSTAKIQDGVTLASTGGTVNVAAGKYSEEVNINKKLTLVGSGNPTANRFSLTKGAVLGKGSGGITAPVVNINSGTKIQDGVTLSSKTVNVGPGHYNEKLVVDKSLAITGSGNSLTSIDGYEAGSVFTIAPSAKVTISGMTIKNGKAFNGGGIYNSGILTVSNCIISGNTADDYGGGGGGIFNAAKATMIVMGSTISSNTAAFGGGIDNEGTATIQGGSTISGNSADFGSGGGIFNAAKATMTVTGSTISSNTATFGGGIDNEGTAMIKGGSTISGNSADFGGGIYNNAEAITTVTYSTVSGNTAMFDGGGIVNNDGTLNVDPSKVHDNTPNDIVG